MAPVMVAALLAGCTGGSSDPRGGGGRAGGRPERGGELRLAIVRPSSLDPARARTPDELLLADQLFDGLVAYDPETLEPLPAVASTWRVSEDQRTWEFVIDPDARFANGRPVTPADVKFTLERIAVKGSGSSVADLLEVIRGFKAVNVDGTTTVLEGLTVVEPDVLRVALDQPLSVLPAVLANPAFGIVPREAAESLEVPFAEQPTGNGPFALARRDDVELVLEPATGREAYVERVRVGLYADREAAYQAFVAEEVDWAPVPPEEAEAAAATYGRDGFGPYVAELFYGFNLTSPTFADVRFREAIVSAVDRQSIATAVYSGTVEPTTALVVEGVPGHQDDPCPRCAFDPDRARQLVAEVFPDGNVPEVPLDFDADPTQEAVAKAIQANLAAVGIPAVLRPRALEEYQTFAVSGEQQLFRLGWIAPYASPDAFLAPLFVTGFPSNLTGFSVKQVDDLIRSARLAADPEERRAKYQEAERLVLEHLPVIPIAQFQLHTVASARVRGLQLTAMGTFDASQVWLAG